MRIDGLSFPQELPMTILVPTVLPTAIVCAEQVTPNWVWSYLTFQRDAGIITGGGRTQHQRRR